MSTEFRIDVHLKILEGARRDEQYETMHNAAAAINMELGESDSRDAWAARSKMTYELHMAAYQQGKALLKQSLKLMHQSTEEARKAGDPVAALFTETNQCLPEFGLSTKERMEKSASICEKAEAFVAAALDDKTRDRANRAAINTRFNVIDILTKTGGDPNEVGRLLKLVKANPYYETYKKDHGFEEASVRKLEAYANKA